MKISKKSWHYRFICFFSSDYVAMPTNLCSYFWNLVIRIIIAPFVICVFIVGSPILGIVFLYIKIEDWRQMRPPRKELKPQKPNILVEYVKAVKNKVCPIIEYE